MGKHYFWTAVLLLGTTGMVRADVAFFPPIRTPEFDKSSPVSNAAFGLSFAAMLVFAGIWVYRHPHVGGALFLVSIAMGLLVLAYLVQYLAWAMSLFLVIVALPMLIWAGKLLQSRTEPYVGKSKTYFLLALAAALATLVALTQVWWTPDSREERRRQRMNQTTTTTTGK